jgi:hypothetical protein
VSNPIYQFPTKDEQDKFQSDIRERDLVGVVEAKSIFARRIGWKREQVNLSSGQYVKVWRPRISGKRPSITFWVNMEKGAEPHHLELDISWFTQNADRAHNKRTARLKFNTLISVANTTRTRRDSEKHTRAPSFSSIRRTFNKQKDNIEPSLTAPVSPIGSLPRAGSISSDNSEFLHDMEEEVASEEVLDFGFEHLDVEFNCTTGEPISRQNSSSSIYR